MSVNMKAGGTGIICEDRLTFSCFFPLEDNYLEKKAVDEFIRNV